MKKIFKTLTLLTCFVGLIGCEKKPATDGIDAKYKFTSSYTLSFVSGGESDLANYLSLVNLSTKDDIAKYIDEKVTSYYEGDRTPDEAIHFTSNGGVTEPFANGSSGSEYNANEKNLSEYSSSVGFLYGKVDGVYHIYTRYSSIDKGNYLDHKRYIETTKVYSTTENGTLYDECLEFDGDTLLLKARGTYSVDDIKSLEFLITLTYKKI